MKIVPATAVQILMHVNIGVYVYTWDGGEWIVHSMRCSLTLFTFSPSQMFSLQETPLLIMMSSRIKVNNKIVQFDCFLWYFIPGNTGFPFFYN